MINIQPIEKLRKSDGTTLQVHSVFYTIQGEGPFTGHPAVFIRLAGCNLQCPGCDTEYTANRVEMTVEQLVNQVTQLFGQVSFNLPLVVITGGEPFRQALAPLVRELRQKDYRIQIETNGTLPPEAANVNAEFELNEFLWEEDVTIVCSPKASRIHPEIGRLASCFKYVMHHSSVDPTDGLPTLALCNNAFPRVARPELCIREPQEIYLQPMDSGGEEDNRRSLAACIASCMKYGYILQVQTHKMIGMP